jgi:GTP cyclohydrolase III
MTNTNFDYKVTLGKTASENTAFIDWATASHKVRLTKSCMRDLKKIRSWGGTHFFISGDNNLLLAKMHLGGSISKVEKIIKSAE